MIDAREENGLSGTANAQHAWRCASSADTRAAGAQLAELLLRAGNQSLPVILTGPLGAGKTEFVRGVAEALGCGEEVASPTFPIVHEYHSGARPLLHFDFYRLEKEEEVWQIGWEEYLGTGIILVEWGEKFPGVFSEGTLQLTFFVHASGTRIIELRDFFAVKNLKE